MATVYQIICHRLSDNMMYKPDQSSDNGYTTYIIILTKYIGNYMTNRPYNLWNGRIYDLHSEIILQTDITDISANKNFILKENIFIHYQKEKYKIGPKSDYKY